MKKLNWDVIISSPLKRAETTAKIIAEKLEIENFKTHSHFIERDFGCASGLAFEEWMSCFPDDILPGKEDDESLKKRVIIGLML